jgi:isopentenyl-diphosphate delta-isomerase
VAPEGIVENEFCPVLVGRVDGTPHPDPTEVLDYHWAPWQDITTLAAKTPWLISPWSALQIPLLAGSLPRHGDISG